MGGLYFLGIVLGIFVALLFKKTLFKGEAVPFVMELPNYRLSGKKNVAQLLWEKSKDFLQRAFTVIFIGTIIIWFLKSFNLRFQLVSDSQQSIPASIAGILEPVFRPVGLGNWKIITSLISGFIEKESVVSTMEILFGDVSAAINPLAAASLLVFSLFVHAVHCGNFCSPPRTWDRLGIWRCALAMCACMDFGIFRAFYREIYLNSNFLLNENCKKKSAALYVKTADKRN